MPLALFCGLVRKALCDSATQLTTFMRSPRRSTCMEVHREAIREKARWQEGRLKAARVAAEMRASEIKVEMTAGQEQALRLQELELKEKFDAELTAVDSTRAAQQGQMEQARAKLFMIDLKNKKLTREKKKAEEMHTAEVEGLKENLVTLQM